MPHLHNTNNTQLGLQLKSSQQYSHFIGKTATSNLLWAWTAATDVGMALPQARLYLKQGFTSSKALPQRCISLWSVKVCPELSTSHWVWWRLCPLHIHPLLPESPQSCSWGLGCCGARHSGSCTPAGGEKIELGLYAPKHHARSVGV